MPPAVLGTMLLVLAVLVTLALAAATKFFTAPPLKGPDAMGYSMVFLLLGFRWLLALGAIVCCLAQGKFGWVSGRPWLTGSLVIGVHAGLGVIASLAWIAWTGGRAWYTLAASNGGAIVLPLLVYLYLGILLWGSAAGASRAVRLPAFALALPGAIGLGIGVVMLVSWRVNEARHQLDRARQMDEAQEQNRLETEQREKDQAAELEALSEDAPLEHFLSHLFIDKSEAHHRRALERIAALPNLTERLARRLADPDPRQREYASNFIRKYPGPPDPAWLPGVRVYLGLLASDCRAAPALYDPQTMLSFRGLTMGALMTARKFEALSPPARFTDEIGALREATMRHEESQSRTDILDLLDRFESGRPLSDDK